MRNAQTNRTTNHKLPYFTVSIAKVKPNKESIVQSYSSIKSNYSISRGFTTKVVAQNFSTKFISSLQLIEIQLTQTLDQ